MRFKSYDPGEDDYLPEHFEDLLERPDDVEKYRKGVEEALSDAEEMLGFSENVEVVFGLADPEKVDESWEVETGVNFHVHGFSYGSWFDDVDRDFIFLYADDSVEEWGAALKNMTVHERAHIDFYDTHSDEALRERLRDSMYDNMLFEGHSTNSAAKVNEEKGYGWSPDHRQLEKVDPDPESLREELEKPRTESNLLDREGEEWDEEEGYAMAYEIFRWVVENREFEIQELPELSQEEVEDLVYEAVEELYG
jgi:hypothetical protein